MNGEVSDKKVRFSFYTFRFKSVISVVHAPLPFSIGTLRRLFFGRKVAIIQLSENPRRLTLSYIKKNGDAQLEMILKISLIDIELFIFLIL
jgi:hypothetical protein